MPTSHVRHPAALNQFYRLANGAKTTRWNNVVNGHNFDSENCMATGGAVAIDAHTAGGHKSNPPQIRNNQTDFTGGIGVDDVDDAWHRLWSADLLTPDNFSWADVVTELKKRRHILVGVDYREVPYAYQVQKGGNFDHAINFDDIDGSMVYRYDSLDTEGRWVPLSAYKAAAERLASRVRQNSGALFAGLTAARPPIGASANHYKASVIHPTSLWNPATKRWVFNGANAIKYGTTLLVRGATYKMGGKACYPVYGQPYSSYYVPKANVKLGAAV